MADPFLGEIRIFAGNFAPQGWLLCDGSLLPIVQNTALFSLLGTFYGGNGTSTFALPDLRGRVPVQQGQGAGLSPYTTGQTGGAEHVTVTIATLPGHRHPVAAAGAASSPYPAGDLLASNATGANAFTASSPDGLLASNPGDAVGGSQPHNNLMPYTVINYIIAATGIFPSRN